MFEHVTHTPSFGPHNEEREAVLTPRSLAVSHHPPGAGRLSAAATSGRFSTMNLVIPPIFFYVVGAMLVIFGAARMVWLGVRRPAREIVIDTSEAAVATAAKARRRHLIFGIVWIALGVFLILSTSGVLRSRLPS